MALHSGLGTGNSVLEVEFAEPAAGSGADGSIKVYTLGGFVDGAEEDSAGFDPLAPDSRAASDFGSHFGEGSGYGVG